MVTPAGLGILIFCVIFTLSMLEYSSGGKTSPLPVLKVTGELVLQIYNYKVIGCKYSTIKLYFRAKKHKKGALPTGNTP
jgi:hypothetical protein